MKDKKGILLIFACLITVIVLISGCTSSSKEYNISFQTPTMLETFDDAQAMEYISPNEYDAGIYQVVDYGTKTIDDITVYYTKYTVLSDNTVEGYLYFQKNGKWYSIFWSDKEGNPNSDKIDSEIADMIKNT